MTTPELMTSPQVAALLNKSARTVHRLVRDEKLKPAMVVGTGTNAAFLFNRADVEALLAGVAA